MKLSAKIVLTTVALVVTTILAVLITLFIQQRKLEPQTQATVRQPAFSEGSKIAQSVYWLATPICPVNTKLRQCPSAHARREVLQAHS